MPLERRQDTIHVDHALGPAHERLLGRPAPAGQDLMSATELEPRHVGLHVRAETLGIGVLRILQAGDHESLELPIHPFEPFHAHGSSAL